MVEVIAIDARVKKKAEEILEAIVTENLRQGLDRMEYRGHVPEFSRHVLKLKRMVQERKFTPEELWSKEGKDHENPNFELIPADTIEAHNYILAHRIHPFLAKNTSEGRDVIWITPVGPMGHYPILEDIMNVEAAVKRMGRIDTRHLFPFAMDEWSMRSGLLVPKQRYPYMNTFREDMGRQFYSLLKGDANVPEKNLHFAANYGLRNYLGDIDNLLNKGAAVLVTGGVGKNGHISFSESTFGVRLGKELAELIYCIIGAPLTSQTIDQNETTSTGSMLVPAFANTTYIGLWVKFLEYGKKNPGLVKAYFGLDNGEEPLKWQPEIAQRFAAAYFVLKEPDPSFAGSYVHQFDGAAIMVRSLIDNIGKPRLAK